MNNAIVSVAFPVCDMPPCLTTRADDREARHEHPHESSEREC